MPSSNFLSLFIYFFLVYAPEVPHLAYCLYQLMFAILSQSILSGAVVERMTFKSWLIFILFWTTLCYDMVGKS